MRRGQPGEVDPVIETRLSLDQLLTYQNPHRDEYKIIEEEEEGNELAGMRATAASWDKLPKMREKEGGKFLPDGSLLTHLVMNPLLRGANGYAKGLLDSGQLIPLPHYEEAVKRYLVEDHVDQRRIDEILSRSNAEAARDLDQLIDEFNADLERVIAEKDFKRAGLFVSSALAILNRRDEYKKEFSERFFDASLRGQILIDLGYGKMHTVMQSFAERFGVKTFIGVDKFNFRDLPLDLSKPAREYTSGNMQVIDVRADMLEFVSRLQTGSANFVVNHIDNSLIQNADFHKALAREMARATRAGGVVFGDTSASVDLMVQEEGFRQRVCADESDRFIFERVK